MSFYIFPTNFAVQLTCQSQIQCIIKRRVDKSIIKKPHIEQKNVIIKNKTLRCSLHTYNIIIFDKTM